MEDQTAESWLWLAEELALQLSRALESMSGESAPIAHAPYTLGADEIDPAKSNWLWQEQTFSLGPEARIWIAAKQASWEEIGGRVLRAAGVEENDADSIRSTYLEILSQALSSVASAASARARLEVACVETRSAAPPGLDAGSACTFDLQPPGQACRLVAVFSPSIANLGAAPPPAAKESPGAAKPATAPDTNTSAIDLLLDVELPVSISFGRAQLPLKDVIKLTTGSIVELNRTLSEPVEVIVNNCVIARGEVVVIEGNYGIRIKQVISRQERLRTLY
ncbi:MAG TPA: flagellar motor switch protein FliN [Bryobacteraceae bacterium]|nr:flagellar motor switch protein FliN [Bryobacteraceae bacterium]